MKKLLLPLVKSMPYNEKLLVGGMTHVPLFMFAMTNVYSRHIHMSKMDKKSKWEMKSSPE